MEKQQQDKPQKDMTQSTLSNDNNSFHISHIINLMKKIKKSDPLFKPVKKLKTAIELLGIQKVSLKPTKKVVAFHFGLGNQLDKQILSNQKASGIDKTTLNKQITILPGKCYCVIYFKTVQFSEKFMKTKNLLKFDQIQSKKLEEKLQKKQEQQKMKTIKQSNQISQKQKEIKTQQLKKQQQLPLFYDELKHQNLSRLMIFLYLKQDEQNQNSDSIIQELNIKNCPLNYEKDQIPGLFLIEDFISKQEEIQLLENIDKQPWQKLSNRRVQHYGYQFKYGRNQIDKQEAYIKMPQFFNKVLKKLTQIIFKLSGQQIEYDQLTINDYFAGHGIPPHFDTHSPFQEFFVAISMLSSITMDFKKYDGSQKSVYLKQRSMVVFSQQARYAWTHGIACRKLDKVNNVLMHRSRRLSLTFRKIKRTPCICKYYFYCDSQGYDQQKMKKDNPLLTKYLSQQNYKKLLKLSPKQIYSQYVQKAYNSFGYDFHNKVIPQIKDYLENQKTLFQNQNQVERTHKFVLDIGCGNGQYKNYLSDKWIYYPTEICTEMQPLEDQIYMNGLKLNFKDEVFDIVLIIAVLHHFTNEKDRIQCLNQAKRVLNKNGVIYLTVFNYQQMTQIYQQQDILLDYFLPTHKKQKEIQQKIKLRQKSVEKQFQIGKICQKGEVFERYYHLFKQKQLQQVISKAGLHIQQIINTKLNLVVKATKTETQL